MNYINYFKHTFFKPDIYHRRYDLDLAKLSEEGKRVALIALPFIGMYRPAGFFLSLGMGSCRILSHLNQAISHEKKGEWKDCFPELGKALFALMSTSASLFHFTTGLFVTTGLDLIQTLPRVKELVHKKDFSEALEQSLQAVASSCYLIFITTGALEALLVFSLVQAVISFYQAYKDLKANQSEKKYLEAISKCLLALIQLYQADGYRKSIQRRNFLLSRKKVQDLMDRAVRGKQARHLINSPLHDLFERLEEKTVILINQDGEHDFGSHFHGFGEDLVKGANLTCKKVISGEKELIEVQFKVNHVYREYLDKSFKDLRGISSGKTQEILKYSGSHVEGITLETVDQAPFSLDKEIYKNHLITLKGLGDISIGASIEAPSLYDRVTVRMDINKTIYDLHEMMAFLDLDIALHLSSAESISRLKIGHLFRTFFPREATPFERQEKFFTLPIEDLKKEILSKVPEMEEIFHDYLENMTMAEILPGRIRYRIKGLAEKAHELGARSLITSVTESFFESKNKETLYTRIASMLKVGLLSEETKSNNHFGYPGWTENSYWTGASDSVFTQMITKENIKNKMKLNTLYRGKARFLISLEALEMGTYQYYGDSLGNRLGPLPDYFIGWLENYFSRPGILEFIKQIQTKNSSAPFWPYNRHEIMLKERIDPSFFTAIILDSEKTRFELLEYLRTQDLIQKDLSGKETILNQPIEQFFRVGSQASEELLNPSFF